MLYSIFIYQNGSGLLIWNKSFEKDMDASRVELFSSFFSAIQSFVKEMIRSGSQSLKNIEMGNFLVKITNLPKLDLDVVMIGDSGDDKLLSKITPKIISVLESHKEIFRDWDGNRSRFEVLDLEMLQVLRQERGIFGGKEKDGSATEVINEVIGEISGLEEKQKENLEEERKFIYEKLKTTTNLFVKIDLLNSLETVDQKLQDKTDFEKVQMLKKKNRDEIESTKTKLSHFLAHTKSAISKAVETLGLRNFKDIDLRDVYLNLYSFSTKLKVIGRDDLSEQYRTIAQMLSDKPNDKLGDIPHKLTEILNLPDDINSYFPK